MHEGRDVILPSLPIAAPLEYALRVVADGQHFGPIANDARVLQQLLHRTLTQKKKSAKRTEPE